jgi:HTH-type transcriptional regulator / antitoxin HigA
MDVRLTRTKRDYQAALKNAEALWGFRPGSKESDRLEVLTLLIQAYESEHYPIPDPDPIEMLLHVMESRALTRKDMEPYIGSRARVAEVLNRVRPLTLEMIRRLSEGLDIPADLLVRRYELTQAA